MTPQHYKILTFGCQMNASDSELMAGVLEGRGLRPAASEAEADVLLVNTCIVRGSAEQRAVGHLHRLKALKAARPDRILGVCGCLAQRDAEALFEIFPHVDLVVGTRSIPALSALIDRVLSGEARVACVDPAEGPADRSIVPVRKNALRALVTIMTGCNNWCSYCIVPAVRGREESRPAGTVVDEVRALAACGCREVTLVGQNVNSYRDGATDFADLLERVHGVEGIDRIRYITSHPRDAGERHLAAAARLEKVCDHFHLPAQSGSTAVLERMNRGYTREHYLGLVEAIRRRQPDATLTTDLIVGFPGESEADFEETLDLVRRVRFDSSFTFFYNPRTGTKAAEWADDIPLEVKKERLSRLIRLQEEISLERNTRFCGRTLQVLVEGRARRAGQAASAGQMMGRATGDQCVLFEGAPSDAGRIVPVRITQAAAHSLFGQKLPGDAMAGGE